MDERINIITSDLLEPDEQMIERFDNKRRERFYRIKQEEKKKEVYTSGVLIEKIRPENAQLRYGENGKPYFVINDADIGGKSERYFNITHSGGKVFCVWSDEFEVGVDFEPMNREINPAVIRRLCTEKEKEYFQTIKSPDDANKWLLELYTCKEAVSKLMGTGLSTDFSKINLEEYSVDTIPVSGGYLSVAKYMK